MPEIIHIAETAKTLWQTMNTEERRKFIICLEEGIGRRHDEWDGIEATALCHLENFDMLPKGLQGTLIDAVFKNPEEKIGFSILAALALRNERERLKMQRLQGLSGY